METDAQINAMAGKEAESLYQLVGNDLLLDFQFEQWASKGYLPKRIAKKGFVATHKEVWTWKVSTSFVGGCQHQIATKSNRKLIELATGNVVEGD